MEIYRTKFAFMGVLVTLIFIILALIGTIELIRKDYLNVFVGILIYLVVFIIIFLGGLGDLKVFVFYDDYFLIVTPLLKFIIQDRKFIYSDIKFARFTYRSKGPDAFLIYFKNNTTYKCSYYSQFFSNDKTKIGEILSKKGVNFHNRHCNKIKIFGNDKWIKIPEELK
jgi:hypothetical protein